MERGFDTSTHSSVELVGGPLDGRKLCEDGPVKFEHNPHTRYQIQGSYYRPWKLENGVLKMRYTQSLDF